MTTLNDYTTATQALLHDPTSSLYGSLTGYINEARYRLALQAECVRFLWQFNAATSVTITATAYTAGTATITVGSTASLSVGMGAFTAQAGGFAPGTVITALTATVITISPAPLRSDTNDLTFYPPLSTVVGQEAYPYVAPNGTNALASAGIANIIQIKSVAVNWGGIGGSSLVTLEQWSFSRYQAFLGYYGRNLQGNPAAWCSYQNMVMMRPVPSSVWPMQWDTVCQPIALVDNTSVEAIPYPYTDSVKYYAAYLAYMNSQRSQDADRMETLYNKTMTEARSFTQRTFVPYVYR